MVPNYYDIQAAERSAEDDTALRQVLGWSLTTICSALCRRKGFKHHRLRRPTLCANL